MNKTRCVIKNNSLGAILTIIVGILMIAATIFIYRYEPEAKRWWTGLMTPDKYETGQQIIVSFVFRILCGISMAAVLFANTDINMMLIPPSVFIITQAASAAITSDFQYITTLPNAVCVAFILYILLFQRVKLLRKNKWVSFAFLAPIAYYIYQIASGKLIQYVYEIINGTRVQIGCIYFSSVIYFSLMYIIFAVSGFSATPVEEIEETGEVLL